MNDKTDNELLQEILFHTKENRKKNVKIAGNTFVVAIIMALGVLGSFLLMSA